MDSAREIYLLRNGVYGLSGTPGTPLSITMIIRFCFDYIREMVAFRKENVLSFFKKIFSSPQEFVDGPILVDFLSSLPANSPNAAGFTAKSLIL